MADSDIVPRQLANKLSVKVRVTILGQLEDTYPSSISKTFLSPHLIQNKPVPDVTLVVDILETLSNVVIIFPTDSSVQETKPHSREENSDNSENN